LGITQEELAERAGLSIRGLRKIEAGQVVAPRPATVRLLAGVFGLAGKDRDRFRELADPRPAGRQVATARPAQLPLDAAGFAGRDPYLSRLSALLANAAAQPTVVPVIALTGAPGVGKTTLAVHWAHQVRDRFPDGQLYVNLRGFDLSGSVLDPAEALRGFLGALDVQAARLPAGVDALAALYRSMLLDRRMLVVLDNARDAEQARPLLPGAPGCVAVVTSRTRLTSLVAVEGAYPLAVELMTGPEARQLLAGRLGEDRLAAEPRAVEQIIDRCARLPLALAITAARAATRPRMPLAAVSAELEDRLGALTDTDAASDARTVFSWSYRALDAPAARLFRLLSLHPGPDFTPAAAASLIGCSLHGVTRLLAVLTRTHLVAESVPGRYSFHDLLRAYAAEQTHLHDPAADRSAAQRRMLNYYLHTARAGALLLDPHRPPIDPPPATGIVTGQVTDQQQAQDWFTAEKTVLLGAIDHAFSAGHDEHAWQLAWATTDFLQRRGHWQEWAASQEVAVKATRRLNDLPQQARAYRYLGRAYTLLGQHDQADASYRYALSLSGALHDRLGQAHAHMNLANLRERQDRYRDALDHAQRALEFFEAAGHRDGTARTLNMTGWYHSQLGDHESALARCEEALTQLEELRDSPGQAHTWDSLGHAHYQLGRSHQAVTCFRRSVDIFHDIGDRYYEAEVLVHLGDGYAAAGDHDAADRSWREAVAVFADINDPDPDEAVAKSHLGQQTAQGRAATTQAGQ
jgi:tetratricopeptide (TPR) repeat protein/transcriptional regulator with XRE-family HTH domain